MQTITLIYILLAGIAALLIALFQYLYKSTHKKSITISLTILRFLAIFSVLLLIINPKFQSVQYYTEKSNLVIAIDNSESIKFLERDNDVNKVFYQLTENKELQERFNISSYKFGKDLQPLDSLNFNEKQSDISRGLKRLKEVYRNSNSPILLISDGNQTFGTDYQYQAKNIQQPIFTVIVGDSSTYTDLAISQLNVNRYAFLKNKFPVEIFVNYSGKDVVNSELIISQGNTTVFNKKITLSASNNSEIIRTDLLANKVGVQTYKVQMISPLDEKNKTNNFKNFAVEVVDQKTNIALISSLSHPDLGAIKKSIESNEQRKVTILKPKDYLTKIDDYQLVIIYQPNNNFKTVYEEIKLLNNNTLTISGAATDWNFLNQSQSVFKQNITNQTEEYTPRLNTAYSNFIIDDFSMQEFPPLKTEFGELKFLVPHDILIYKSINGIDTNESLLSTAEVNEQKHALISGEGFWRWRSQSYLETGSFASFDNFIGKLIQYLSSNKKRSRINIDYKSFYNGNEDVVISAQYFNKSYEFDPNANLIISLEHTETSQVSEYPLILINNNYRADLSGIKPGAYNFVLKNSTEPIAVSGTFEILEYNVEQQFLNANIVKLQSVSNSTEAKSYFINNSDNITNDLISDNRFKPIQKSTKNIVPLIDWKYLLFIIAFCLSAEWFIRKYNGLI